VRTSQQNRPTIAGTCILNAKSPPMCEPCRKQRKKNTSIAQGGGIEEDKRRKRRKETEECNLFRRDKEPDLTRSRLVLATRLSLLEAALESLARPRPLLHTLDVAGILHDNVVIVHENVHLAVRVVVVLVVIIVVIAH
jgi:hypothetical protein